MRYSTRYIHKISPSVNDVGPEVEIPEGIIGQLDANKKLGKLLREGGVMAGGAWVREHRIIRDLRIRDDLQREDDAKKTHLAVFPVLPGCTTYWHSIILTPVES